MKQGENREENWCLLFQADAVIEFHQGNDTSGTDRTSKHIFKKGSKVDCYSHFVQNYQVSSDIIRNQWIPLLPT